MGVDYLPLKVEPIRAIGAGTIVDIGSWGMYGPWFDYKLANGQLAGKCIYVAEHIGSFLPPGTRFNAGDTLASAYPGPYWTEWGWARRLDTPAVTWAECSCTDAPTALSDALACLLVVWGIRRASAKAGRLSVSNQPSGHPASTQVAARVGQI
jgi:hypothetical protein